MFASHARRICLRVVAGLMVVSLLGACAPTPAAESRAPLAFTATPEAVAATPTSNDIAEPTRPNTPTTASSATPEVAAATATPEAAAATPTPRILTRAPRPYTLIDDLILNENPRRYTMFNNNTLAYGLPGMKDVEVVNYTYAFFDDGSPLTIDFYYPPDTPVDAQLPTVIFGIGYRMSKEPLRNEHFYTSWGKLVAAAGMAAVIFDTEQPAQDLETVLSIIQDNAAALRIDPDQLGLMASSGNVPTVMSYLMQAPRPNIQFAVYYFGLSLTPDRKFAAGFAQICAQRGCLINELMDVSYVDPALPLFIVEAGLDDIPNINEGMDHFIAWAEAEGAPLTMIYFEDGKHGFDTQKTEESAAIVAQTVEFMQAHFAEQQ